MLEFEKLFISFFIFSCIGWIIEELATYPDYHRFVNRGFLIGPYCPIYGCGYVFITLFLTKFYLYPVALFFLAVVICSILEYLTSYLMEKLFHARWWDYSQKRFNINGRICLIDTVAFGILGLLIIYLINPFYIKFISSINENIIDIVFYITSIIFFVDVIMSVKVMNTIKEKLSYFAKDNTNEIKRFFNDKLKLNIGIDKANKVKNRIIDYFKNEKLISRMLMAFPNFIPVINIKKRKNKQD